MTTPDFRYLCGGLLDGLDRNRHPEVRYPGHLRTLMAEARDALAQSAEERYRYFFSYEERRNGRVEHVGYRVFDTTTSPADIDDSFFDDLANDITASAAGLEIHFSSFNRL